MIIFERKQQKPAKRNRSYVAETFACLQPEMAGFERLITWKEVCNG